MTGDQVRPRPCPSCPYRRDAPSGLWKPEEYAKLLRYDGGVVDQVHKGATAAFACHSTPRLLCSGWVGHRSNPDDLLAVRIGVIDGRVDRAVLDYATDVPLWSSGAEAAEHGLRDVDDPGPEARAAMRKVARARSDIRHGTGRPVAR